eukprot:12421091-Karenia_brevis.AAC.1
MTLLTISRVHWQQDIRTAALLIKRDPLGQKFLTIVSSQSGTRVGLRDAASFSTLLAAAKLGQIHRDIQHAERAYAKNHQATPKKNKVQTLLRKARLWIVGDARHVLSGVLPDEVATAVRDPSEAMRL